MSEESTAMQAGLTRKARQFTLDNFLNPTELDFLMVQNAMLAGASYYLEMSMEMGGKKALTTYAKATGIAKTAKVTGELEEVGSGAPKVERL